MSKPRITLLSGWGVSPEIFSEWTESLNGDFDLQCLEYPDLSDQQRYTVDERCRKIVEHLDAPTILLGWSLGGALALDVAARYPDKIQGLVLLGCNPCFVAQDDWPGMDSTLFTVFHEGMRRLPQLTLTRFTNLVVTGSPRLRGARARLNEVLYPTSELLTELLGELRADRRTELAALSCPVLALFADNDALVPDSVRLPLGQLAAQPSGLRVELVDYSSHLMFLDQPERCSELLLDWILALQDKSSVDR